ncbi:hypothetical protein Gotur_001495 [Gossypium turneri]
MASGDPHISFAVRRVYRHSRGCCSTAQASHRRECGHGRCSSLHYAPYRGCTHAGCKRQYDDRSLCVDIGGYLILLQSWALYRMPFLASISHQSYVFLLVNRWSTNPGIGRSPTVLINHLMIENHAGEEYIPTLPVQLEEIHGGGMEIVGEKCTKNILRYGTTGSGGYFRWIVLQICSLR